MTLSQFIMRVCDTVTLWLHDMTML